MNQPAHYICDSRHFGSIGHIGSVDQNDRQTQRAGRIQFGPRTAATRVFGDDETDAMGFQQGKIAFICERSARNDDSSVGQRRRLRWGINEAQKVMMLGRYGEVLKLLAADREEDTRRLCRQSGNCRSHVGHGLPLVSSAGLPSRTLQCEQGNAGEFGGFHGVQAHLRGKRVGCVDEVSDAFLAKVSDEACHSAKAADANRQGLANRRLRASGVRENACNALIGHGFSQIRGFGGSSQYKGAGHG